MAYLGRALTSGNYLKLDDISSQFNGSTKTFSLTSGGNLFYPGSAFSIQVVLGGVIQEPESAYTINQNQITFASAPGSGDDFFCVVLGTALGIGVPGEGTVSGSKLTEPFDYNSGLLYLDSANNRIGVNSTTPTAALDIVGNVKVSGTITAALTGTATSTTNIPNLTGAITSNNTTTSLGSFSSANLATALTDETGSGSAVFATSPTLSTVTVSSGGINVTGVSTFSGGIQGNVTGNVNSSGVSTFSSVNVTGNVSIGGTLTYDDVTNVDSIGLVTARSGVRIDAGGLVVTAGVSTFTNGPVLVGTATSTGTAAQPLQVTGGAYVSGSLGIGIAGPSTKLAVYGSAAKTSQDAALALFSSNDATNPFQLIFYRSANSISNPYYYMQSVEQSVAYRNLVLQPNGGNLLVGSSTDTGGGQVLQVTGGAYVSGKISAGSASFNTNFALSANVLGEAYNASGAISNKNPYTNAGTVVAFTSNNNSVNSGCLIDFNAYNSSNAATNIYLGAVAGGTENGPANFVVGRRTGAQTWAESMRIDSSGRVTTPYQPAFMAGSSTSSRTTNVGSVLDFNTEANSGFDIGNNFNTTNYRFTAPVAGTYAFSSNIYQQNAANISSFCWRKNGTQLLTPGGDNLIFFKSGVNIGDSTMCSNILLQLAVNDYIDIAVRSGSSDVTWYGGHSWIMGYLIG